MPEPLGLQPYFLPLHTITSSQSVDAAPPVVHRGCTCRRHPARCASALVATGQCLKCSACALSLSAFMDSFCCLLLCWPAYRCNWVYFAAVRSDFNHHCKFTQSTGKTAHIHMLVVRHLYVVLKYPFCKAIRLLFPGWLIANHIASSTNASRSGSRVTRAGAHILKVIPFIFIICCPQSTINAIRPFFFLNKH